MICVVTNDVIVQPKKTFDMCLKDRSLSMGYSYIGYLIRLPAYLIL